MPKGSEKHFEEAAAKMKSPLNDGMHSQQVNSVCRLGVLLNF